MTVRASEPGSAPAAHRDTPRPRLAGGQGGRADTGFARLVSHTVPLEPQVGLLALLPADIASVAWVRQGEGLVGWGEAARLDTHGADRIAEARTRWAGLAAGALVVDEVGLRGTGPVAFGSFAFANDSPAGGSLVVPETVVGRRGDRWWLTRNALVDPVAAAGPVPVPELSAPRAPEPLPPRGTTFTDGAAPSARWQELVGAAVARIRAGAVDKVVLARDLLAQASEPVDLRAVLRRLAESYPATWTFTVDGLVGATPELLVRTEDDLVSSRVLAGTVRPTGDGDRDRALAAVLARSGKDLVEHEFAVRSVAEALEPFCAGVDVPQAPFVLPLANVMHLATDVTGMLRAGAWSLDLAAALHPSAAVCGTPREAAAELIAELEPFDRGRYAGPVGWLDASGDGEWGLALRCGQVLDDPRELRLFAGCGIVDGSNPAAELAESTAKLVAMRDALADLGGEAGSGGVG